MKRAVPWIIAAGVGAVLITLALRSPQHVVSSSIPQAFTPPPEPAQPPTTAQSASPGDVQVPPQTEGTVAYTFADEAEMRKFAGIWQQRQKSIVRLGVLQAYWNNEQGGLAELNNTLSTQYGLDTKDPSKQYRFSAEKRTLMTHTVSAPAESAPADAKAGEQPSPPAAEADTDTVIHTFATDEEMHAFGQLWQQRQAVVLRMAVLESLGEEERTKMTDLNQRLVTDYKLDVKKNYSLDPKRRVLLEHEAPPASAGQQAAPEAAQPPAAEAPAPQTP